MKAIQGFLMSLLFVAGMGAVAKGQQLFTEDFSGFLNGDLGVQGGWVQNGSGTDVQIDDVSPMTYVGYLGGGGKYIKISTTNGTDPHHTFSAQLTSSSFTLWYSFLIRVTSAPTTTGDYFVTLRNTANSAYGGRIFARQGSSVSNVQFGISKAAATADNYSDDYDVATTYLLVVKYVSNTASGNDEMYLWVNPSLVGGEPGNGTATVSHNAALSDPLWGSQVDAIMIHQRHSTNSIAAAIDGIRVGGTWNDSPLPVQLMWVTGSIIRAHDVEVAWKTVSETNNFGFEIHRKRGVVDPWTKIGFVEGRGTTLAPQSYSYIDRSVPFGTYSYRIRQIDLDGKVETFPEMEVNVGIEPGKFILAQNYPNPFNPTTTIEFVVPQAGRVSLKVYNLLGQEVATLHEGSVQANEIYSTKFDATGLSSGLYFYQLRSAGNVETKRMMLMK